MDKRFEDLKKIPRQPARRLLALANTKLETKIDAPAAAPVDAVLAELVGKQAHADTLRLLSAALPVREAIWWGCLAAGDLLDKGAPLPAALAAARTWVFKPTAENRDKARAALEMAEPGDDTALVASAVAMYDGKLGTEGDLAKIDAPAGAASMAMLALNVMSLSSVPPDRFQPRMDLLIDRALDIARGGNGQLDEAEPGPTAQEAARTAAGLDPEGETDAGADGNVEGAAP